MLYRNNKFITLASGAVMALSAFTANAQIVPNPVSGDLFLGFRASGGTGASTSYIVKLGTDATFRNAVPGSTITVNNLGDIATDLIATYGATWYTRPEVHWGIFGVRPSANPVVYASRARTVPSQPSESWPTLDLLSRSSTATQITSVLESVGGYLGSSATANSLVATLQSNSGEASSYNKQVATAGVTDFGSLSEWTSIEGDFSNGANASVLDLFRIGSLGVTRIGTFSISSVGSISFTAYASPTVDTDGDGSSDADEVFAGTSVTDPTDFFKVQNVSRSTGNVGIGFKTIPARSYQVYYTPDLVTQPWQLIDTVVGAPTPQTFQYNDTNPTRTSQTKGFYKVAVTQ